MKSLADYAVYLAVRLVIAVIQALPLDTCQRLARPLAYLASDILRIRQSVVRENLQHAFPHFSETHRDAIGTRGSTCSGCLWKSHTPSAKFT